MNNPILNSIFRHLEIRNQTYVENAIYTHLLILHIFGKLKSTSINTSLNIGNPSLSP